MQACLHRFHPGPENVKGRFGWHIVFLVLHLELVFNRMVLCKEGKDESVNPSESHSFAVSGQAYLCKCRKAGVEQQMPGVAIS